MKKSVMQFSLFTALVISLVLISGCSNQGAPETPQPTPSLTSTPALTSLPPPPGTDTSGGGITVPGLSSLATAAPTLVDLVPTRTAIPTATPDAISEAVLQLVQNSGISGQTILWLKYADWINLGISLLFVLAGYLLGTWLIHWLLPRLVRRTKTNIDDLLLQVSGNDLRWLAVVTVLRSAVKRLSFVSAGAKNFIIDICFFLALYLIARVLWRLINLAAKEAERSAIKSGQKKEAESLITLSVWALRFLLLILVATLLLGHFAVNVTGFALFLGIIVLVLSLASRDILADVISGAMILVDRPFRIGDRLELSSINSWGDVVEIGMRSTKILSMENRMVVLPNSQIGKSEIINYSYPDPSYFNLVKVMVAYDNDPNQVSKVLEEAIRSVEGVQTERDIVAWLMELTEYQMVYWAAWWVATYEDRYPVQDRVIQTMIKALKDAGIVLPYQKSSLNVQVGAKATQAFKAQQQSKEDPAE